MDTLPFHTARSAGAAPRVVILSIVQSVNEGVTSVPREPSRGVDEALELRLHEYDVRVGLPRSAEVRGHGVRGILEGRVGSDGAPLEHKARDVGGERPALGRVRVLLALEREAREEHAILEHGDRVPEDEVDGATDGAPRIELPVRQRVESVLVPIKPTRIEDRVVRVHT